MGDDDQLEIRYATDQHGIRRQIVGDDEVPEGWTLEQSQPEEKSGKSSKKQMAGEA